MSNVVPFGAIQPETLENVEAEQALLGACMFDNAIIKDIAERLGAEDFFEQVHGTAFAAMVAENTAGRAVNPLLLKSYFTDSEPLKALGGMAYLARLSGDASGLLSASDLADQIHDLGLRRRMRDKLARALANVTDLTTPSEKVIDFDLGDLVAPQQAADLLPIVDFSDWFGKTPPERQFAWGGNIPLGYTTMLTGPGGVGKSLLEQMLCTCIALGLPFLGENTRQMNTLYVTCEDDADELWRRQEGICAALKVPLQALVGKLHLVSLCGEQDVALATFDDKERLEMTGRWRQLAHTCESLNIRLYAFDNATDAMAGDLNSIHQVAEFVNLLTGLALRLNGAAMILHHPNKAGDDWLGSVAWHNKVRSRLIIKHSETEGDDDGRVLENPKANYGPSGGKIHFRWFKGAFISDHDLPEDAALDVRDNIRAASFNRKFLECLQRATEERRNVSHAKSAANFAPRVFAGMTIGRGYDEKGLSQAMERLLFLGSIEANQKVFQYDNRHWANGMRIAEEAPE